MSFVRHCDSGAVDRRGSNEIRPACMVVREPVTRFAPVTHFVLFAPLLVHTLRLAMNVTISPTVNVCGGVIFFLVFPHRGNSICLLTHSSCTWPLIGAVRV